MSSPIPFNPSINLPINADFYQPRVFFISALVKGAQTTITTSVDHDYVVGQLVRVLIPYAYGTWQISKQQGYVLSIPAANQVLVDINSSQANSFIPVPTYNQPTKPQIIAIGDINSGPINASGAADTQTFIDGSFINISPQ